MVHIFTHKNTSYQFLSNVSGYFYFKDSKFSPFLKFHFKFMFDEAMNTNDFLKTPLAICFDFFALKPFFPNWCHQVWDVAYLQISQCWLYFFSLFFWQSIQIWLKSIRGPIDVYLCPEEQVNAQSPMKDISPIKRQPAPQTTPSHFLLTPEKTPQNCDDLAVPSQRSNEDLQRSILSTIISPRKNILLQTNDETTGLEDLDSDALIPLSPNLTEEEYLFTLTDTEGITDLFDSYNFWNEAWYVNR